MYISLNLYPCSSFGPAKYKGWEISRLFVLCGYIFCFPQVYYDYIMCTFRALW